MSRQRRSLRFGSDREASIFLGGLPNEFLLRMYLLLAGPSHMGGQGRAYFVLRRHDSVPYLRATRHHMILSKKTKVALVSAGTDCCRRRMLETFRAISVRTRSGSAQIGDTFAGQR